MRAFLIIIIKKWQTYGRRETQEFTHRKYTVTIFTRISLTPNLVAKGGYSRLSNIHLFWKGITKINAPCIKINTHCLYVGRLE